MVKSTLMLPFVLNKLDGQISATGSVLLRQTDLALKPLSFMMGAITVQHEIAVKLKLVAAAT